MKWREYKGFPSGSVGKESACSAGHAETWLQSLHQEEMKMAIRSNILAWENTWTQEPGRLESMGHMEMDTAE